MSSNIVIVGAGQAGLKVAETLRDTGVDTPIVMIGDEPTAPYQRPPLSKKYLVDKADDDALALVGEAFYSQAGVDLRLGCRVTAIDTARDAVVLDDGSSLPFAKLVLATGSAPRRLTVAGADRADIHMIRTRADAIGLRERLPLIERVAVVGGGYVGLETAASLRRIGKAVTVLEMEQRLLTRALCPEIAGYLRSLHEAHGVSFRFGTAVSEIVDSTNGCILRLSDGTWLEADAVIAAIGGVPNDQLAAAAGIACNNGIEVDRRGRTSRPNVYAAGDCARFWSKRYDASVRLESVQNANDQARAVAEAIAGRDVDYDPVPWFWSDQYDAKLQMVGLSAGFDKVQREGDPTTGAFALTYYRGGELLAASAINHPRAFMTARRALERAKVPA